MDTNQDYLALYVRVKAWFSSVPVLYGYFFFIFHLLMVIQVACGKRAGAFACLLDETGRHNSPE